MGANRSPFKVLFCGILPVAVQLTREFSRRTEFSWARVS